MLRQQVPVAVQRAKEAKQLLGLEFLHVLDDVHLLHFETCYSELPRPLFAGRVGVSLIEVIFASFKGSSACKPINKMFSQVWARSCSHSGGFNTFILDASKVRKHQPTPNLHRGSKVVQSNFLCVW